MPSFPLVALHCLQVTICTGKFSQASRSYGKCDILSLSAENKIVPAHGKALIDTQISIAVPVGTYGRIAPRSGLGSWSNFSKNMKLIA